MKYGIFALIMLLAVSVGCRSRRTLDHSLETQSTTEKRASSLTKDSTRTESSYQDSTTTTANTVEYTVTTTYRDDGGIQAVQKQWRRTGSARLSVSTGRTSAVSVDVQKTDSGTVATSNLSESVKEQNTTDSRPVQGIEWLWVMLTGGVIALVGLIIVRKKLNQ